MKDTPKQIWLATKIGLTLLLAFFTFYYEFFMLFLAAFSDGGEQAVFYLLMLLPVPLFFLIWLPKKKKFMLPLICASAALLIAVPISYSIGEEIKRYNESLIIDTAPAINVSDYLPFDEDSKIVNFRSETVSFQENPPIIDGAAALFPVYSAFVNATYPEDTVLDDGPFQYNNTPGGYAALAKKETDLFIGVYPSEEQLQVAEENGTHFTFTPIGYDAFVFFVHKDNLIDSLTADQIRAIYSGEITNWKELGGKDEEIVAYQRNEGSGSQSMLLRFMGDKELMKAPSETINSMDGIIRGGCGLQKRDGLYWLLLPLLCGRNHSKSQHQDDRH